MTEAVKRAYAEVMFNAAKEAAARVLAAERRAAALAGGAAAAKDDAVAALLRLKAITDAKVWFPFFPFCSKLPLPPVCSVSCSGHLCLDSSVEIQKDLLQCEPEMQCSI